MAKRAKRPGGKKRSGPHKKGKMPEGLAKWHAARKAGKVVAKPGKGKRKKAKAVEHDRGSHFRQAKNGKKVKVKKAKVNKGVHKAKKPKAAKAHAPKVEGAEKQKGHIRTLMDNLHEHFKSKGMTPPTPGKLRKLAVAKVREAKAAEGHTKSVREAGTGSKKVSAAVKAKRAAAARSAAGKKAAAKRKSTPKAAKAPKVEAPKHPMGKPSAKNLRRQRAKAAMAGRSGPQGGAHLPA